jgi:hypothetical protein
VSAVGREQNIACLRQETFPSSDGLRGESVHFKVLVKCVQLCKGTALPLHLDVCEMTSVGAVLCFYFFLGFTL